MITRANDLLWCIVMLDIEGTVTGRSDLLEQLGAVEARCRYLNEPNLYSAVIRVLEEKGNRIL